MITLQFLEPGPHIAGITPQQAGERLKTALDVLPVDCLLLGWDLPVPLVEICRKYSHRSGVKLYRWHPLLTGDGIIYPRKEWRTRNLKGKPLPGFRDLPEFTFVCPNNPEARDAVMTRLSELAQSGLYDGFFLDRMRFPSPASDLIHALSCFCKHCHMAAAKKGLDLEDVRVFLEQSEGSLILDTYFGSLMKGNPLADLLDFRQQTITEFISTAHDILRLSSLEVGLDCFSPSLTRMVGQDLEALSSLSDWTKLMIYGHAFGPATLPFEFANLTRSLMSCEGLSEIEALRYLSTLSGFSFPDSLSALREVGLSSQDLAIEFCRGHKFVDQGILLAGVELVEIPVVSELNALNLEADLRAFKTTGVDGFALSWDLWHMPLERLSLVAQVWGAG